MALVLTRQDLPVLDRKEYAPAEELYRGAYILSDAPDARPELILIASGSEVNLIINAAKKLKESKIAVRLVSMPSWELFEEQTPEYRESVLPASVHARIAVEAGTGQGWERYTGARGLFIGVEKFGSSAPGELMMREYGLTVDNICKKAMSLLDKK